MLSTSAQQNELNNQTKQKELAAIDLILQGQHGWL